MAGGGLLSLSPHPQRDKDGHPPPKLWQVQHNPGPLSAEPDVRAAVAGSRQADDSNAGRWEASPRVSWAPAPLTMLSVGCDFGERGGGGWGEVVLCLGTLLHSAGSSAVCFGIFFFPFPSRAFLSLVSGMKGKLSDWKQKKEKQVKIKNAWCLAGPWSRSRQGGREAAQGKEVSRSTGGGSWIPSPGNCCGIESILTQAPMEQGVTMASPVAMHRG